MTNTEVGLERDVEYDESPVAVRATRGAAHAMAQLARRGEERVREALNSVRDVLASAAPDAGHSFRRDRNSLSVPSQPAEIGARPGAGPMPPSWVGDAGDDEYPQWLEDVLREQAALLEPAARVALPDDQPHEPRPEWLEDVLREQAALLGPTAAFAPPLPSPGNSRPLEIGYYHAWLDNESQRRTSHYFKSAWQGFTERVRLTLRASGGETALPFATIESARSAITTLTRGQAVAFSVLAAATIAGLYVAGPMMLTLLLGGVTLAYLVNLTMTAVMAARVIGESPEVRFNSDFIQQLDGVQWPQYTVLCPLYRETAVVPQFVAAMRALDYPQDRLQVLFLTESDDDATREAIHDMDLPANFEVVTVPDGLPRTKPRACNFGLLLAKGSFIVIYDAEDVPDPLQLKKAVLTFAYHNPSLACVQAKLGFYNTRQNVLTRWFAIEYALWFNMILPGLQWARLSLPLGGTSNHFRTDVLRRLGGWDAFNVTEDCDLGLRLAEHHLYTTILDSTTLEEANSNVRNWIRQRSRWIKGYMQTYLVHLRRPWDYILQGRTRELFSLHAIIGGTPATFLVNPLMWMLLGLYIAERQTLGVEFHILYVAPIFYPAVICLVAGNFLYMYLCLVACAKSEQFDLLPWVLTLPLCWALMCVAAGMALFQLIVKPHHWEKTHHGLHLSRDRDAGALAAEPAANSRAPTLHTDTANGRGVNVAIDKRTAP